jgi:hypothetical protein
MRLSRSAIALYLGIVFVSGGVVGFYANRLYTLSTAPVAARSTTKNPGEFRKGLVSFYKNRLHLVEDQVQKLELILDDVNAQYQEQFKQERERTRPELNRIHDQQVQRIHEMLTPQQQPEYEKMLKEREQMRQKKGARPGGPGV